MCRQATHLWEGFSWGWGAVCMRESGEWPSAGLRSEREAWQGTAVQRQKEGRKPYQKQHCGCCFKLNYLFFNTHAYIIKKELETFSSFPLLIHTDRGRNRVPFVGPPTIIAQTVPPEPIVLVLSSLPCVDTILSLFAQRWNKGNADPI